MAQQQQSSEDRGVEIFSLSIFRFRLCSVNPGKNTYMLIAVLVGAAVCLSLVCVFIALALRH